jgi:hypothetical protein
MLFGESTWLQVAKYEYQEKGEREGKKREKETTWALTKFPGLHRLSI